MFIKAGYSPAFFIFTALYKLKKILLHIFKCYSLDQRALALMRIGIGIIVIADLFIRGSDLKAHYTDSGIWSVQLMYTLGWKTGAWSLHALSGEYYWESILFTLHFIFAVFLMLGYKTKLSTLLV